MKGTQKVAVVIPFYRNTISPFEEIALTQCQRVLDAYPLIAVKPESLELPARVKEINFTEIVSFDDKYFDGIAGYNALMLAPLFYNVFLGYEYILIHQLDAFVFKDELAYWCNQGYDYMGAPWLKRKSYNIIKDIFYRLKYQLHTRLDLKKKGVPTMDQFYDKVGNGGFSLRRVQKFHDLSISLHNEAQHYLDQQTDRFNEDAFWSILVNRDKCRLNIPHYKTGVAFAVEFHPERAAIINNGALPFGCHAWDKYLHYWRPIFEQYGYEV